MSESPESKPDGGELPVQQYQTGETRKRDASFWFVILAINLSSFLALLEATIVSTALPTIVNDLHGNEFIWIGSAYNLAAAAFMPSTGSLSQVFGRKAVLLGSLLIFSVGSALCGSAHHVNMLIAGRAVQGFGAAGILSSGAIIISDIVPLSERGTFNGILQLTWCLASGIGPILGGTLAEHGDWRWIFYLNLPIAPIAGFIAVTSLHLKIPRRPFAENVQQLDIVGNLLIVTSTTLFTVGIVWGGAQFPWNSAHVVATLSIGVVGILVFIIYEYKWSPKPLVPVHLMLNRTTLSGYLQVIVFPIPFIAVIYYLPLYFQACKGASPIRSGLLLFGLSFSTPPIAIISGIAVSVTKRYRGQLWIGWMITIAGLALFGTTHAETHIARVLGYEIFMGTGFGIVFAATYFPVLAPLPITSIAQALAFFFFLRQFTQIIGISIGGAILQNELIKRLPADFLARFVGHGVQAIDVVPQFRNLPQEELNLVREAFADSLGILWYIMAGISGLGLIASMAMKHHELHTRVDEDWGVKEKNSSQKPGVEQ